MRISDWSSDVCSSDLVTWAIVLAASAVLIVAATWIGVPGMVGAAIAEGVGRAGFRVEQVEVTGLKRMDKMTVYAVALDQQSRAMPLVDLEEVRQKLLRYGWIEDAHVSRRLPDTLLIQIDERTPAAIWQDNGQLTLIDASGGLLEPGAPAAVPTLDRKSTRLHSLPLNDALRINGQDEGRCVWAGPAIARYAARRSRGRAPETAALRLDRGCPRLAAAARHAADPDRRAHARRDLAG